MKTYKLTLLALIALLAGACRKDAPELINPNHQQLLNTPSQVFEAYWHGMNNSYAFWEIDPTDWDQVYDEYLPQFEALDNEEIIETQRIIDLYTAITEKLVDHHYSLTMTNINASESDIQKFSISPSNAEVLKRDYYHEPLTLERMLPIIQAYKEKGRIQNLKGGINEHYDCGVSYNIDNGIIYIYLNGFSITGLRQAADSQKDPVIQAVNNFQNLILTTENIRGVVIDVRNNNGGYLADMQEIFAPMIDQEQLVGHTHTKNGPGRLDYGPWTPCLVPPALRHRKIEAPIVVLADIHSISMAEMTAMAVRSLPNGYVVGERTWGGTGPLFGDYNFSYGGSFENSVFSVYSSTSLLRDIHGNILEGRGVTPDLEARYDDTAMENGTDTQLEKTLAFIANPSK